MLKMNCLELLEGRTFVNNYKQEKTPVFVYKIIHFSMHFSAVLNMLIVKT